MHTQKKGKTKKKCTLTTAKEGDRSLGTKNYVMMIEQNESTIRTIKEG